MREREVVVEQEREGEGEGGSGRAGERVVERGWGTERWG